ncbi:N-acetyltransferase [Ochrobactrum sp. SFR4]|uniref:GNAT family N-acetyltransferase n=1 Tax=Ochrobactrum sp. SFR4 TaxID=2717368 RepID=UPI001C8B4083|nr:N-acetyltransferase [Ochrobactrum sp. SFR4]MBX8827323.1 GNAT family N-acetyltransferase [Ochrobactrum sp. SFR4]
MTNNLSFHSLADASLIQACDVLNMAYEGYIVPVSFDPVSLARRIQAENIDLVSSQLLTRGQETIGILLIARRGNVSRIAALGVVKHLRGAGIGKHAVAHAIAGARARGDDRMVLEVIETNEKAISTYEKAGFKRRRTLVGYMHDPAGPKNGAIPSSTDVTLPLLIGSYPRDMSWQTAPICFAGASAPIKAFQTPDETAAALVDASGQVARLLAFAVHPAKRLNGVGRLFMASLLGHFPNKSWTIPAILPASQAAKFLISSGWLQSDFTQLEMELHLDY